MHTNTTHSYHPCFRIAIVMSTNSLMLVLARFIGFSVVVIVVLTYCRQDNKIVFSIELKICIYYIASYVIDYAYLRLAMA